MDHENAFFSVVDRTQRTVDILVFIKACVRTPVRIDKTIQTEISVVLHFSVVPAVKVHSLPCFRQAFIDSVVTPFPYKAAAEPFIFFDEVSIFHEISGTVPHGMTIFDKEQRFLRFVDKIFVDFVECRIHSAENVDI